MAVIQMSYKGYRMNSLTMLLPDKKASSYNALWLLQDGNFCAEEYLYGTKLKELCKEEPWYVICISLGNHAEYKNRSRESHADWEDYVTVYLWNLLHQIFPEIPRDAEKNYLGGVGISGEGAVKLCRAHPDKYGRGYKLGKKIIDWNEIDAELKKILEGTGI